MDDEKNAPNGYIENSATATKKQLGGCTGSGFMPGKSGNPGGRPKYAPISAMFRELFSDPKNIAKLKARVMRTLLSTRARTFKMSEIYLLREILDRLEGRVPAPIELSGDLQLNYKVVVEQARQRVAGHALRQEPKALLPEAPVIDAQPEPVEEPARGPSFPEWIRDNNLQPPPPPADPPPPRPLRTRRVVVQVVQ